MKTILRRFSPLFQLESNTPNGLTGIQYASFASSIYCGFFNGGSLYLYRDIPIDKGKAAMSMYIEAVNNSLDEFRKIWAEQAIPIRDFLNQFDRELIKTWYTYRAEAKKFSLACIKASDAAQEGKKLITIRYGGYVLTHYRVTSERCNTERSHVDTLQTKLKPQLNRLIESISITASTLSQTIDGFMSRYPNAVAYGDLNRALSDLRQQQESLKSEIASHDYSDVVNPIAGTSMAIIGGAALASVLFPPAAGMILGVTAFVGVAISIPASFAVVHDDLQQKKLKLDAVNEKVKYLFESQELELSRVYTTLISYLTNYQTIISQIRTSIPLLEYFCKKNEDQFSRISDLLYKMNENFEKYSEQSLSSMDIDVFKNFSSDFSEIWKPGRILRNFSHYSPDQLHCFFITEPVFNSEKMIHPNG